MWNAMIATMVLLQLGCRGSRAEDASSNDDLDAPPITTQTLQSTPAVDTARVPAQPSRQPGDAEILGAINARDANLIEASTMAKEKAGGADVQSLAAELLDSHGKFLTRGGELAKQLQLSRELPPDSMMARTHAEAMDRLSLLSGAAFDQAYVRYVLDAHQAEARKVTAMYLPGASDPAVKALVADRLTALRAHQEAASTWLAAHPS